MKVFTLESDPSRLFRYRDSIYATDLLVCAIAYFDFFTFLKTGSRMFDEICDKMKVQPRPADVLLSLLLSMELLEAHDHRFAFGHFDLAPTRSIESKGMSSRVKVVAGNMFEELPTGYDIHLFANAFHDWDIDSVEKLSANSFRSLSPGGIIAVFDAHLN